jgi:hypothetical protein
MAAAVVSAPVAPASALTVDGAVADAIAGSSGAPAGTVLTMFVEADPGTRVPRAVSFTVGQGLLLGASGPTCDVETIRASPVSCPLGSEVGEGALETATRSFRLRAFTLSPGSLAVRIEGSPAPVLVDVTTANLDEARSTLTLALPAGVRGEDLLSLRLRLGGDDPASDWVRSTLCPNGTWSVTGSLIDDAGIVGSASALIACRPPRRAQLGRIIPTFSLSQTRRNGVLSPLRLDAAILPAGLPADATVHVTCRAGCRRSWRQRVNPGGPTRVRVRPGVPLSAKGLRLQVAVASPSVRGTYLVIAFTRGADGRPNGWKGTVRGCVGLGSAPVRMPCPT